LSDTPQLGIEVSLNLQVEVMAMLNRVATFAALLLGMSACSSGLFNVDPGYDGKKDSQGNSVLLDTNRNWQDWVELVDLQIKSEIAGSSAPGFATWDEKWSRQLRAIEKSQENAPRYIDYILDKRRQAGLPDLVGYQPPR
jgi:hypothetical protein